MSLVWVKAGQCNQETTIEARRSDMTSGREATHEQCH